MVMPERETPGISAQAWARPNRMPCFHVSCCNSRMLRSAIQSAKKSTTAMPASIATVTHRLRKVVVMASSKNRPSTTMGSEPMITSQPMRASGSLRSTRPVSDPIHAVMMRTMSCQK